MIAFIAVGVIGLGIFAVAWLFAILRAMPMTDNKYINYCGYDYEMSWLDKMTMVVIDFKLLDISRKDGVKTFTASCILRSGVFYHTYTRLQLQKPARLFDTVDVYRGIFETRRAYALRKITRWDWVSATQI